LENEFQRDGDREKQRGDRDLFWPLACSYLDLGVVC
jgi:hypothetical protein